MTSTSTSAHVNTIPTTYDAPLSPLLRLPAELRNAICTYVFSDDFRISFIRSKSTIGYHRPNYLALTRICHQTHRETALLPFKLNMWVFGSLFDIKRASARLTPQQRDAIRSVCLTLYWRNDVAFSVAHQIESMTGVGPLPMVFKGLRSVRVQVLQIGDDKYGEIPIAFFQELEDLKPWFCADGKVEFCVSVFPPGPSAATEAA